MARRSFRTVRENKEMRLILTRLRSHLQVFFYLEILQIAEERTLTDPEQARIRRRHEMQATDMALKKKIDDRVEARRRTHQKKSR